MPARDRVPRRAAGGVSVLLLALLSTACPAGHEIGDLQDLPAARGPVQLPAGPPRVRVRLRPAATASGIAVRVTGPWTLLTPTGKPLAAGGELDTTILQSDGVPRIGRHRVPPGGALLRAEESGEIRVADALHAGVLRVTAGVEAPELRLETDLETYLVAVVAGEVPSDFPAEALRAQAIVARTYTVAVGDETGSPGLIDMSASGTAHQEYGGLPASPTARAALEEAVASTRGLILNDGGKPFRTYYHSTCGGHTCPAGPVFRVPDRAPLRGVPCGHCESSRYFRWTARVPGTDVLRAAGMGGPLVSFAVGETLVGGRARTLRVSTAGATKEVAAAEFRLAVGPSLLRSTLLDGVRVVDGDLLAEGRGWGHGVGLCQIAARDLAAGGRTAEEILARYYPGADAVRAW